MTMHEKDTEKVISNLLDGVSADEIAKEFPGEESEVHAHARVVRALAQLQERKPKQNGLHHALRSVRTLPYSGGAVRSPFAFAQFTKVSFAYRSAFALPILFLVLIASGFYFLPYEGEEYLPSTDTATMQIEQAPAPNTAAFSVADTADTARSMKGVSLVPASSPELPQDAALAAIYGSELSHDTEAATEDSAQVEAVSDDGDDITGFTNAYDKNEF